ncbi:MAG: 3-phosphoshikimate 1-carboxyvinyltransferase, partial [Firmicutes bacterium]|nr:3-phosphoshikimate 1-carboxyvinyltransferase [Bacillota bacterium]
MVDSVVRQQNTVVLQPGVRIGTLQVPSSKSQLHRLLICAALGERPVAISYRGLSEDIAATVRCLNALGAKITVSEDGPQSVLHVSPLDRSSSPSGAELDCGESGSTLRFLLPVAGLLGADCTFVMQGRLSKRPLAEYGEQLTAHGMTLKQEGDRLKVSGRLTAGDYVLPGNISSQFISGLLMAFGALQGQSRLQVVGTPESKPYIDMTEAVLRQSGIVFEKEGLQWTANGGQKYVLPESLQAEGDYSSATFFL